MATFPTYATLVHDLAEQPDSAVDRTDMESGPPKQLLVRSRTMVKRPVRYLLSSLADYNSFMTWFRDTVHYGTDWFDWTDPVDSATKQARIVSGNVQAMVAASSTTSWFVTFTLETWSA